MNEMTHRQAKRISRYMALLLRHDPKGLVFEAGGWTQITPLLKHLTKVLRTPVTQSHIEAIVHGDVKRRYEIQGDRVRARYGHSKIEFGPIGLVLDPRGAPTLYHGTTRGRSKLIWEQGILPMARQYVHLSDDLGIAAETGRRRAHRGDPVYVFRISGTDLADVQEVRKVDTYVYLTGPVAPRFLAHQPIEGPGYRR